MSSKTSAVLASLHKVSRRLKLGRVGDSLTYFLNSVINRPSSTILKRYDMYDYLNFIHPDVRSSAIGKNVVESSMYDLQIVIPVYNTGSFLKACIDSVLTQNTHYSYHCVIVNDGSTDSSNEILSVYASDSRVTIINQSNKGISGARNTGLSTIFGRYVTFLDSDDMLAPDAITHWMDAAYKYDADVVEGSFRRRNTDGKLYSGVIWPEEMICDKEKMQGIAWLKVYKAELWENIKFPEKYWFEDSIICGLLLPMVKKYVQIPNVVYYYTLNRGSISFNSRGRTKMIDNIYITKSILHDAESLRLFDNNYEYLYRYFLYQTHTNWDRTYMLGHDIEYAVFLESVNLFNHFFPTDIEQNGFPASISKALRSENFPLYRKTNLIYPRN